MMYTQDIKEDSLWLMKGDCLERMKEIPDGSVDMVLADPPYGTRNTFCFWRTSVILASFYPITINRFFSVAFFIVLITIHSVRYAIRTTHNTK